MQRSPQDSQSNFEMSLRDQLIAAQNNAQAPDPASQQAVVPPPPQYGPPGISGHNEHPDDPSMGPPEVPEYTMGGMDIDDAIAAMGGGRQDNRRELSSSKRAAQNRAAQRAFRQRKEAYIGKLEKQVKDHRIMEDDIKALQQENYQLREYILSLQSRILETSSELPPPPAHFNLQEPGSQPQPQHFSHPPPAVQNEHTHAHPEPLAQDQPPPQDQAQQLEPPEDVKYVKYGTEPEGQHHDRERAPAADMSTQPSNENESIPQAAVEQLQAAAAEAGGLGGNAVQPVRE